MDRIPSQYEGTDSQRTLATRATWSSAVPGRTAESTPGGMPSRRERNTVMMTSSPVTGRRRSSSVVTGSLVKKEWPKSP